MIIGLQSHISYLRFTARLGPIALGGLVIGFLLTAWIYRAALRSVAAKTQDESRPTVPLTSVLHRQLLVKSLAVTIGAVVLFFAGAPMEIVALSAAAILLLDRVNPERVYQHVDWGLLVMFAGLFVVVRAFEVHVVSRWDVEHWTVLQNNPIGLLSVASAALSNLVSNVPAVLLFKPVIAAMPDGVRETAWLALAMSSTLAGNLTVLGSVANLIVVENARREGVVITFWEYVKVGVPVTLLTLAAGIGWLHFARY